MSRYFDESQKNIPGYIGSVSFPRQRIGRNWEGIPTWENDQYQGHRINQQISEDNMIKERFIEPTGYSTGVLGYW